MARWQRSVAAALVLIAAASAPLPALGSDVYCYAQGQDGTVYVSPVFVSDDDPYLLSALYSQSLQDVGLSTCVTGEDERDVPEAWLRFIDGLSAQNTHVVIHGFPSLQF